MNKLNVEQAENEKVKSEINEVETIKSWVFEKSTKLISLYPDWWRTKI